MSVYRTNLVFHWVRAEGQFLLQIGIQNGINPTDLKTLFNIMETPLIFFFTLMSVLYDDVEMDQ